MGCGHAFSVEKLTRERLIFKTMLRQSMSKALLINVMIANASSEQEMLFPLIFQEAIITNRLLFLLAKQYCQMLNKFVYLTKINNKQAQSS